MIFQSTAGPNNMKVYHRPQPTVSKEANIRQARLQKGYRGIPHVQVTIETIAENYYRA